LARMTIDDFLFLWDGLVRHGLDDEVDGNPFNLLDLRYAY